MSAAKKSKRAYIPKEVSLPCRLNIIYRTIDLKYRSEIVGLSSLAIVPVILFHAGFTLFSRGFICLDLDAAHSNKGLF